VSEQKRAKCGLSDWAWMWSELMEESDEDESDGGKEGRAVFS
jgi:hypothetical protein